MSSAERKAIEPYREYVDSAGPLGPIASTAALGGLGAFLIFVGVAVAAKFGLPGLLPIPVGVYALYVCKAKLYPRKVKQRELAETLRREPRRLLDPEYRSRFDDLVDADAPTATDSPERPPEEAGSEP